VGQDVFDEYIAEGYRRTKEMVTRGLPEETPDHE
jgi:hypothetical protein